MKIAYLIKRLTQMTIVLFVLTIITSSLKGGLSAILCFFSLVGFILMAIFLFAFWFVKILLGEDFFDD